MLFYRQRRFVIFSLVCLLSVLLLAKFAAPLYLKAQSAAAALTATPTSTGADNVGSNTGEGDITTQVSIINNVIAPNGGGPGYPVTVTLYVNSPAGDVQMLADAIKSHSFFPIVRIDKTCEYSAGEARVIVGLVRQSFGPDTIIEFGNEINNGDIECKNWPTYQQNYQAVQSSNLSPSAIDFYMGNPAYTFDKLPGSLQGIINGANPRTANSYGCVGATSATCDDNAMQTFKTGLTGTDGKNLYVTEFSLAPGKKWDDKDAPDSDLTKVIQFIQKYSSALNAQKVTPLIRNVCSDPASDGQWLIYVKGQIYTKNGRNVTKSCANLKNPYYEFNIQRENSQNILNNFNDEYSVACLPKEEYTIGFENDPKRCLDPQKNHISCPADWQKWNIPGKLKMTVDGKAYGLFRNESAVSARTGTNSPPNRMESVESFISTPNSGAKASTTNAAADKSDLSLRQAPMYSLTTLEQQCTYVVAKLKAVHELCKPENRVDTYTTAGQVSPKDNGEECGLNTDIPGTSVSYDQESMLSAFQNKNMTCKELTDSPKESDKAFVSDLVKVNVSMETAYRPAFIVAVTTFDNPQSTDNVITKTAGDDGKEPVVNQKFQVVDYLEVKIPAIATDFLPPESTEKSSSLINADRNSYRDPMALTADVLRTSDFQKDYVQQQIDDRKKLRAASANFNGPIIGNNGNMPIFCNVNGKLVANCDTPSQSGADYKDQIPQALVTFINASSKVETHDTWDSLPCNSNEVEIYGPENKERIAEEGKSILAQLKAKQLGPYTKKTEISTNITVHVEDMTKGGDVTTHTELYFVTPQRYALQYAQESMLNFLSNATQLGYANAQETIQSVFTPSKFSPLLRAELAKTLTGREVKTAQEIVNIQAPANPVPVVPGKTPPPTTQTKDIELIGLINDVSDRPYVQSIFWRVAGQAASLPTRMMSLLTTKVGSAINDYTRGCTGNFATDNWFSGNCLRATDESGGSVPASPTPGTPGNICIETKLLNPDGSADTTKLNQYAADLMDYLGQPNTANFWDAYFAGYLRGAKPYLFSANDQRCNASGTCYSMVIQRAVENRINPYLAIAIALNETGGFRSLQPDWSGPHFGCGVNLDPNGPTIGFGTIPAKLNCMVGAFNNYYNQGMNPDAALTKYGYANGSRNQNLTKIIGIISHQKYLGVCN